MLNNLTHKKNFVKKQSFKMSSDSEYSSDDSVDYYDDHIDYEEDLFPAHNDKRPHEEMSKFNDLMFRKPLYL